MARKINYISPVDSIQGAIGSKQDLRYAKNDNKGYYSPAGTVNRARNYQTRIIGQVRSRTGAKYYSIRQRSSFNANAATRHACALMAGARLIAKSWMQDLTILPWAQAYWSTSGVADQYPTFYSWMFHEAYWRLAAYSGHWQMEIDGTTHSLGDNPWQPDPERDYRPVPQAMLVKFWSELCLHGDYIYINGQRCLWRTDWEFEDLVQNEYANIMGVAFVQYGTIYFAKVGDFYIIDADGEYVRRGSQTYPGTRFYLTQVNPPV